MEATLPVPSQNTVLMAHSFWCQLRQLHGPFAFFQDLELLDFSCSKWKPSQVDYIFDEHVCPHKFLQALHHGSIVIVRYTSKQSSIVLIPSYIHHQVSHFRPYARQSNEVLDSLGDIAYSIFTFSFLENRGNFFDGLGFVSVKAYWVYDLGKFVLFDLDHAFDCQFCGIHLR